MEETIQSMLHAYGAAWREADPEKRGGLLEQCWSAKGRYMDPSVSVEGREALSAHIGGFHAQMPGARIELTSGASAHNGRIYFTWRLVGADGAIMMEGVDFGTISETGQIEEIVGFFGAPPSL